MKNRSSERRGDCNCQPPPLRPKRQADGGMHPSDIGSCRRGVRRASHFAILHWGRPAYLGRILSSCGLGIIGGIGRKLRRGHGAVRNAFQIAAGWSGPVAPTMLVAGRAKLSDDGDIVELLPKHTAVAVDKVDVGIFKLRASSTALERRIERLSEKAGVCGARAVLAKKEGQKNLCLVHLKRRKMCKDEIDRTSASLLNVEKQLHALERTRADADVIQAFKLARDAMNMAHKSEEEGGKGLHPEDIKELMDEMANLTEESNEVTKMIIDAGVASGVGEISKEELEQELEALKDADVDVDDLANILAATGLEHNDAGENTTANHAEAVAEEATNVAGGDASVARGSTGSREDEEDVRPKKSGLVAL